MNRFSFAFSYLINGSLPLMLSMCQDFGFDNSSETEPCDKPSTNSPKSCKFAKFNIGICTQQPSYVTVSLFMAVHEQCGDICMDSWYMGQVYCKKWLYWIEQNCFITFYSPALLLPSYLLEILNRTFHIFGRRKYFAIGLFLLLVCSNYKEMWISNLLCRSEHETGKLCRKQKIWQHDIKTQITR